MQKRFLQDFDFKDIHYYVILLSAPVLLTIYRYHGYPGTLDFVYDFGLPPDQAARIMQFAVFFFLTFIIPVLYIKLVMRRKLTDFGLGPGDWRTGIKFFIMIPLLVVPVLYFATDTPGIRAEYPLAKSLLTDRSHLLVYELLYVLLYYVAWEFYFRGFLLFGLKDRFGAFNAVLIQTISSCLVHIGKPESEIAGSILAGIVFGLIALRTKSIWYVFVLHATVGILTDIFIIYGK